MDLVSLMVGATDQRAQCDERTLHELGSVGNCPRGLPAWETACDGGWDTQSPGKPGPSRAGWCNLHVPGSEGYTREGRLLVSGGNKLYVPESEQIKNIKNALLQRLLYLHFTAGTSSFDLLTGMYFFLVLPLPLPATFQVTNFSA